VLLPWTGAGSKGVLAIPGPYSVPVFFFRQAGSRIRLGGDNLLRGGKSSYSKGQEFLPRFCRRNSAETRKKRARNAGNGGEEGKERERGGFRVASNAGNKKGKLKRRFVPRPMVLPAEEVSYEPPEDWPEEVREYLFAYARTGNRTGACRLIRRSTRWADKIPERFGIDPDELTREENAAYLGIVRRIEQTLQQRAMEEPGMPGVTSAIFLLKAADPERFAERRELRHSGTIAVDWVSYMRERMEEDGGAEEP